MKIKFIEITIIFLLITVSVKSQINSFNIGGSINLGSIAGNSPSVTSGGGSLFFDFYPWFEHDVSFRTSIIYSQKIDKFLPGDNVDMVYPFIKAFSLRGFIRQDFSFPFYLEEGAGVLLLNDRTFVNINVWDVGTSFAAMIGYDFRQNGPKGFCAGAGFEYGITFTNTNANYLLYYIQGQYYF
jgi:hypothetical protein